MIRLSEAGSSLPPVRVEILRGSRALRSKSMDLPNALDEDMQAWLFFRVGGGALGELRKAKREEKREKKRKKREEREEKGRKKRGKGRVSGHFFSYKLPLELNLI